MGQFISLTASDGHSLSAYEAEPTGAPRGGVVVVQEIFGVNAHIRKLVDEFAAEGYRAMAPALFDRVERGVDLGYGESDVGKGFGLRKVVPFEEALRDVDASVKALRLAGRVGVVGYCWGGTIAWLAASRIGGISAVSAYYGGGIAQFANARPKCPVQLHFGEQDKHIPRTDVNMMRLAWPHVDVHTYSAGHGFNCDARDSYDAVSAALARQRTLELFNSTLG